MKAGTANSKAATLSTTSRPYVTLVPSKRPPLSDCTTDQEGADTSVQSMLASMLTDAHLTLAHSQPVPSAQL